MGVLPDTWIREMSETKNMIEPYHDGLKRDGVISYGCSSYGYDARVAPEFRVFTNVDSVTVDPKAFSEQSFVERNTDVCIIPLEPEWEGHVTLEFSNTTPLPAKVYANEGACQFLFLRAESECETSYADRAGKYMGQRGVTLPKL